MFIKYRAHKQNTKKQDYCSWQFVFAGNELCEIKGYIQDDYNLTMALVCGEAGLSDSEIAVLDTEQIKEILSLDKTSLTISRMKNERYYRASIGGGRNNSMQVKANRFDDVFRAKK